MTVQAIVLKINFKWASAQTLSVSKTNQFFFLRWPGTLVPGPEKLHTPVGIKIDNNACRPALSARIGTNASCSFMEQDVIED
jgi:hypothetical protein